MSPLPRDPALDTKTISPKGGKRGDPLPRAPQKPMKHVSDTALETSLILNNVTLDGKLAYIKNLNNLLNLQKLYSLAFESLIDNEFAPLPPLQETTPSRKNSEILDHKKHIEEIEAKMNKCMQISVASSSITTTTRRGDSAQTQNKLVTQSSDEAVFAILMKEEQMDLERMKYELKQNQIKKESALDKMCDDMTRESPQKKAVVEGNMKKKKSIDSAKKTKLLAALKAIDGNDSFEKS